jgi:hypothetical protein
VDSLVGENLERVLTQAAELQGGEN